MLEFEQKNDLIEIENVAAELEQDKFYHHRTLDEDGEIGKTSGLLHKEGETVEKLQSPDRGTMTLQNYDANILTDNPDKISIFQGKMDSVAIPLDPKLCTPWMYHNRDISWLTIEKCADLISSIANYGQHQPALVRPSKLNPNYQYEIIYGVRRWFSCSSIPNQKFWAYVTELDDRACTILMHTENANSKDISEFERAYSFAQQLKSKIFKNQSEMAEALGLSQGNISKMVKASEIFDYSWLQVLFKNKLDIPIKYAYILSTYLKKTELLDAIINEAKLILIDKEQNQHLLSSSAILRRLINAAESNHVNLAETIVLKQENKPIVSCRRDKSGKVHIVINSEAKSFNRSEIHEACLEAINKLVFSELLPGE